MAINHSTSKRVVARLCLSAAILFAGEWTALRGASLLWRFVPVLQGGQAGSLPFYALCLVELLAVTALFPEATRTAWWPKRGDAYALLGLFGALMLGPIGARLLHWVLPHAHAQPRVLALLAGGLLDPLAEEWAFRGALWRASERATGPGKWSPLVAAAFTSLLFGLWHIPFEETSAHLGSIVLANAAFGLCLAIARWRTGGIAPGVVVHAAGNAFYLLVA